MKIQHSIILMLSLIIFSCSDDIKILEEKLNQLNQGKELKIYDDEENKFLSSLVREAKLFLSI